MAKQTFRAGIIGLGMIGGADPESAQALGQSVEGLDGTHYGALSQHPNVEVVAGSTRDAGRRDRFAKRSGAKVYADYREMLKEEKLDIVSVATYAPSHAEMAIAAARAGAQAVWCEKPIATTMDDAERIVEACFNHGTLLVVNHQRRFDPNHRKLRDLIAEGQLGDLTSCLLQWGSGRLGNVGTHTFDAIRLVTGREVAAVSGHLDMAGKPDCRGEDFNDPGGWGMLRMQDGLIVLVDAADYGAVPFQIAVNGTKGRAIIGGDGIAIHIGDGDPQHWKPIHDENSFMHLLVKEMVHTLTTGEPFPMPGEDAVRTLEAIVAFHASHAKKAQWVELPLQDADREFEVKSG